MPTRTSLLLLRPFSSSAPSPAPWHPVPPDQVAATFASLGLSWPRFVSRPAMSRLLRAGPRSDHPPTSSPPALRRVGENLGFLLSAAAMTPTQLHHAIRSNPLLLHLPVSTLAHHHHHLLTTLHTSRTPHPHLPKLAHAIRTSPRLLTASPATTAHSTALLRAIHLPVDARIVLYHPSLLTRPRKLRRVLDELAVAARWGPLNPRVVVANQGERLVRGSVEGLRRKGEFFEGVMGLAMPRDVLRFRAALVGRSLGAWTGPRHAFLWERGRTVTYKAFICGRDDEFCREAGLDVREFQEFREEWRRGEGRTWEWEREGGDVAENEDEDGVD